MIPRITPEAEEFIETAPFHCDGMRKLGTMLPADDAALDKWLSDAGYSGDEATFGYLLGAAAISGRRLATSILRPALLAKALPWHLGWVAWRMEGNVAGELLEALEVAEVTPDCHAMVLFIAAASYLEQHSAEELPRQIMHSAAELSQRTDLSQETITILEALGPLVGDEGFLVRTDVSATVAQVTRRNFRRQLDRLVAHLEGPFEKFLHERQRLDYISTEPQRRAVEHIGRNEKCRCGSGKKYKNCCLKQDQERLRHSSTVAGVTREEINLDPLLVLTETGLTHMRTPALLQLDPKDVPLELQEKYLLRLAQSKNLYGAIDALKAFGRGANGEMALPDHLHGVWEQMFEFAIERWQPQIAKELMEIFPNAEEKLGRKPDARVRMLLTGHDLAKAMGELADTTELLLRSGDSNELERLTRVLLDSPYYRGIGILFARSLLPIVEEKSVPELFDAILAARAKLDLSPEDEFSEWMDQRALRKASRQETAAMQQAQDKLVAKVKELRRTKEERARLERELALRARQERRDAEQAQAATPDAQAARDRRELKEKIERLNALVTQRGEEKLALRRELEQAGRENEALKAGANAAEANDASDHDGDEDFVAEGNQPVRLIEFPKGFANTLTGFPRHVGRAAMNRIGRIASGEPAAFDRVKQLKAYPDVLRARVADKYRLLFCLLPDRVRLVDLIRRADLDRRIERLQASGLPPVN